MILSLFLRWDSENILKKEEVTTGQSTFPYLTYYSGALLDWKGDSITNYYYGLRLRHRGPMSQSTQWHVTRSRDGSEGPVYEDLGSTGSRTP